MPGVGFADNGGIYFGSCGQTGSHIHLLHALIISKQGSLKATGSDGRVANSRVIFAPFGSEYSLSHFEESPVLFIHIDPFSEEGMKIGSPTSFGGRVITLDAGESYLGLYHRAAALVESELPLRTEDLVRETVDALLTDEKIGASNPPHIIDERIARCLENMRISQFEEKSLEEMAAMACLSSSRFSHLFSQVCGCSYAAFKRHRKLVHALARMAQTADISDAAHSGGFFDHPHFSHAFKEAFGLSPSQTVDKHS